MWKPRERQRVAQEVAERLREMILTGEYRVGDKLPPERRLAEELGVNRATLREAMKNLEHMGLVHIRQGDGTRVLDFVQTAGLDLLRHLVPLEDDSGRNILRDILEFRQIMGREVARLAAERATAAELAELRAVVERPGATREQLLLQDLDFYLELARATHNLVFALLLNTVAGTVRSLSGLFANFNPPDEEVRAHQRTLLAAIEAHAADEAARAADQHLRRGKEHLLERLAESGPEVRVRTAPADGVAGEIAPR
jgi:DNA-binding FadR family transcriptional regulator